MAKQDIDLPPFNANPEYPWVTGKADLIDPVLAHAKKLERRIRNV